MIRITLNGEPREIPEGSTIAELLDELQINNRYCAVERNQEIIPREQHAEAVVDPNDEVEIVTLVGGG